MTTQEPIASTLSALRDGHPPADDAWFRATYAQSNWSRTDLVRGYNITITDYRRVEDFMVPLIRDTNVHTQLRKSRNGKMGIGDYDFGEIYDDLEDEFSFFKNRGIPRSWRDHAMKGWVRDLQIRMRNEPEKYDPMTPMRKIRSRNPKGPISRDREASNKKRRVMLSLEFCQMRIHLISDPSAYTVVFIRDLIPLGQPIVLSDGQFNVQGVSWTTLVQTLQDDDELNLEGIKFDTDKYAFCYKDAVSSRVVVNSDKKLQAALVALQGSEGVLQFWVQERIRSDKDDASKRAGEKRGRDGTSGTIKDVDEQRRGDVVDLEEE